MAKRLTLSEAQCNRCKVFYPADSLNGQSVVKSTKHECLNCLELEVLTSPISFKNQRRPTWEELNDQFSN